MPRMLKNKTTTAVADGDSPHNTSDDDGSSKSNMSPRVVMVACLMLFSLFAMVRGPALAPYYSYSTSDPTVVNRLRSLDTHDCFQEVEAALASASNHTNTNIDNNKQTNKGMGVDPDQLYHMKRRERLEKYVMEYNYTPPWDTFHGPAPECGAGPDFAAYFGQNDKVRSRLNEDKIIYERFFKNKMPSNTRGTYIEMGAFNGMVESNSRFFDVCLGWKGLLVEANPVIYPQTRVNRPQAHRISYAPSCSAEYEEVNKTISFHAAIFTNAGLEGSAKAYDGSRVKKVNVPCGPFQPVLEDIFHGQHINFFSLDVEGAEAMVLENIDFSRLNIDVLMIEAENSFCRPEPQPCESRDKVRSIMEKAGYALYKKHIHASDLFVHPRSQYPYQVPE